MGLTLPFADTHSTSGDFPAADRLRAAGTLFATETACEMCGHPVHKHVSGVGCLSLANGRWCGCDAHTNLANLETA